EVHAADLRQRADPGRDGDGAVLPRLGAARPRDQRGRKVPGDVPAAAYGGGYQRPRPRRQAVRHRRPVRGDARAARRVLSDRGDGPRRGDRDRRPHPGSRPRHGRGPAGRRADGPAGTGAGHGRIGPRL
ncbi:MAG: DGPFAETKE domain protein, partial [uncultured Thermomicrobiales bacterium]